MRWTLGHVAFLRILTHCNLLFIENPSGYFISKNRGVHVIAIFHPQTRAPTPEGKIPTMCHLSVSQPEVQAATAEIFVRACQAQNIMIIHICFPLGSKGKQKLLQSTGEYSLVTEKIEQETSIELTLFPFPLNHPPQPAIRSDAKSHQQITCKNHPPLRPSKHFLFSVGGRLNKR